jgi:hypothetical protein
MRTVEPSMHVTANFRCQVHTPLIMEPGHEVLASSEHVTLTPVVAVILATGPFETVVANFDATERHCRYAKNMIHLLDMKINRFEHFKPK